MKVVGIIPARAGSERLPKKNKINLDGKPLIWWTINAAQQSAVFNELVVTTDDSEIANIALLHGCKALERPPELCQADTASLPVVQHAFKQYPADLVCLLQPTSPFRNADDIVTSERMLAEKGADAVVSVSQVPENYVFELSNGQRLRQKINTWPDDKGQIIVTTPQFVKPNGALYWITGKHLNDGGDWYSGVTYAYVMPPERSIDIDTKADLERAREMVKQIQAANERQRQHNERG